jgi:hypothetical protein
MTTLPQDHLFMPVQIHNMDLGGWLRFFSNPETKDLPDLPFYLSYAVSQFFRTRPHYRPYAIVPIHKDGKTVEMHVWYAQVGFPDYTGIEAHVSQGGPAQSASPS